jgi:hypothetical protein
VFFHSEIIDTCCTVGIINPQVAIESDYLKGTVMSREYSPIDIGLDALGVHQDESPATTLGLEGKSTDEAVAVVGKRMKKAMQRYPELKSDILVASMHLMLDLVDSVEDVMSIALPSLARTVDTMAA